MWTLVPNSSERESHSPCIQPVQSCRNFTNINDLASQILQNQSVIHIANSNSPQTWVPLYRNLHSIPYVLFLGFDTKLNTVLMRCCFTTTIYTPHPPLIGCKLRSSQLFPLIFWFVTRLLFSINQFSIHASTLSSAVQLVEIFFHISEYQGHKMSHKVVAGSCSPIWQKVISCLLDLVPTLYMSLSKSPAASALCLQYPTGLCQIQIQDLPGGGPKMLKSQVIDGLLTHPNNYGNLTCDDATQNMWACVDSAPYNRVKRPMAL